MLVADEQRQPHPRILPDLAQTAGRVPVPEVPGPPAKERVHILHDRLDAQQQSVVTGQLPDPVACMLHRPVRGPVGEEHERLFPVQTRRAHQPVVEPEKVQAFTADFQVHDPGLGRLRLQAEFGQQRSQAGQRPLGHINRLASARDLLAAKGYDTRDTVLACYSGAGFTDELRADNRADIALIGLEQIYAA